MNKIIRATILLVFYTLSTSAQLPPKERGLSAINQETVLSPVRFLASDWLEGREVGTRGGQMAGAYLSSLFGTIGLLPDGDSVVFNPDSRQKLTGAKSNLRSTFFQSFQVKEFTPTDKNNLAVITINGRSESEEIFTYKTDFDTNGTLSNINIKAPVVFAGYGYTDRDSIYNDFAGVDVKGKILVRFKGLPGEGFPESKAAKHLKALNDDIDKIKNELAKSRGALAIIEISEDKSIMKNWVVNDRLSPITNEEEVRGKFYNKRVTLTSAKAQSLPLFKINQTITNELLPADKTISSLKALAADLKNISFEIPEKKIAISSETSVKLVGARNIIGRIDGKQKDKFIVVGAHYDHLGYYDGKIWNGADDNASGVSAVINIARAMITSETQPEYTLIFACWDGEERGLLGSQYFLNRLGKPENILFYLNFDMIGRDAGPDVPQNKVAMIYTEAFKKVADLSKKHVREYNLDLDINYSAVEKPESGSDNTWFAKNNVPLFWFHTGGHADYHQPTDHVELINSKKMEAIIKLSYLDIFEFATGTKPLEN